MNTICVYCGSSFGSNACYSKAAQQLGLALANQKIGLVYGGGNVGLMGVIAQTVVQHSGRVIGVIPKALSERELAYTALKDLRIVNNMHERKALMAELADGFIAMPGGYGTLEEFFEAITWSQLAIHHKPCGLLNVNGFFNPLIDFIEHTVEQGFVSRENREMILMDDTPEGLIHKMREYTWADAGKIDKAIASQRIG